MLAVEALLHETTLGQPRDAERPMPKADAASLDEPADRPDERVPRSAASSARVQTSYQSATSRYRERRRARTAASIGKYGNAAVCTTSKRRP